MRGVIAFGGFVCALGATASFAGAPFDSVWQHEQTDGVTMKSREVAPGTFEVVADGFIDATVQDVEAALVDIKRYPDFMPYVKETTVLSKRGATTRSYTRVEFVFRYEPRDYVTETTVHESTRYSNTFRATWRAVPEGAPSSKDVVRVLRNEGEWIAEGAGARTKIHYRFIVSPGGEIPSFAQQFARREGVLKVFDAVEQQANDRAFKRRTYSRMKSAGR